MKKTWLFSALLILLCALAPATFAARKHPLRGGTPSDRLLELVGKHQTISVIVGVALDTPWAPDAKLDKGQRQREHMRDKKDALLGRHRTAKRIASRDYQSIPFFVLDVDEQALRALLEDDAVASVTENVAGEPTLVESMARIRAPQVHARGFTGAGQSIVILDTGVDAAHSAFGGRISGVDEACFSGATTATSMCPDGVATQFGWGAGAPCTDWNSCAHGTQVAGVAAGNTGVAPAAKIIPIQIYTRDGDDDAMTEVDDIAAALQYVHTTLVPKYGNKLVVNMSFTIGPFFRERIDCDEAFPPIRAALDLLAADGVLVVGGAGNGRNGVGRLRAIRAPACMTGVFAVGASTDPPSLLTAEEVASYSDMAGILDLLAPGGEAGAGQGIVTPDLGGGTIETRGTSLASPHVAGALALLRQAKPSITRQSAWNALTTTGTLITDTRDPDFAGFSKPRIDIDAALTCPFEMWGAHGQTGPTVAVPPTVAGQIGSYAYFRVEPIPSTTALVWPAQTGLVLHSSDATGRVYKTATSIQQSQQFFIKATNAASNCTRQLTFNVCVPPAITTYTPLKETQGGTAMLLVTATGNYLSYQWYKGDSGVTTNPIPGEIESFLNVAPSTTSKYWVRVFSLGLCSVNSPTMTVKVCANPNITSQPQNKRVFPNKTATLSVTATNPSINADPLKYAWFTGSTLIPGATSTTYTTPPITAQTTYGVEVSSGICKTVSNVATVSLCTYPEVVNASPATTSIVSGGTAQLTLPALSPVLGKTVTWYRGASGDRTNPVSSGWDTYWYTTPPLTATTQYWAEFDESGCLSRTTTYTVSVCKPTITAQPQNATVLPNAQHTLSVTATGTGLTYQWYTGSSPNTAAPIAGATSSTYTTPALTATTSYWVRVTGCTTANSTTATVTVCAPPAVTSITKIAGDTYNSTGSVTVNATGTSLTYQWYKGQSGDTTQPIAGATAATHTFTRINSQYYWARVRSSCNPAVADSPAIFSTVDPVITSHPQSVTIAAGSSTTLTVAATGTYLTYQWYQGTSTPIAGATAASYTTPALSAATNYWCDVISGGLSHSYSNTATVSICEGPDINSFSSTSVGPNSWRLTVNVSAEDQGVGVAYHWYSGTRGNPAQSVDLGEGSYYRTFYDLTQQTTYWVRVWWDDYSCYTDTAAKTLTPQ